MSPLVAYDCSAAGDANSSAFPAIAALWVEYRPSPDAQIIAIYIPFMARLSIQHCKCGHLTHLPYSIYVPDNLIRRKFEGFVHYIKYLICDKKATDCIVPARGMSFSGLAKLYRLKKKRYF